MRLTGIGPFAVARSPRPPAQLQPAVTARVSLAPLARVNNFAAFLKTPFCAVLVCFYVHHSGTCGAGIFVGLVVYICTRNAGL